MQGSLGRAIWWRKEKEKNKQGDGWMEWERFGTSSASLENILHCWDLFTAVWRNLNSLLSHHFLLLSAFLHFLFCFVFLRRVIVCGNWIYFSFREELRGFFFMYIWLTLWMTITPPEIYYTQKYIDNLLMLPWRMEGWEKTRRVSLWLEGRLMIMGLSSPPTCQPDGICCPHWSTNYTWNQFLHLLEDSSLCPPPRLLSFSTPFSLSPPCFVFIFFPLFCPARNRPLISSLCLSPKWEKFEPRGSREANTTLLHLPPPIPITLAFLLSVFFYPSCLTVPLSWPSDRACFITSNPLTWQSSPHSEGKIE